MNSEDENTATIVLTGWQAVAVLLGVAGVFMLAFIGALVTARELGQFLGV